MNFNIGREVMLMEKNFMTVEEVAEELKGPNPMLTRWSGSLMQKCGSLAI